VTRVCARPAAQTRAALASSLRNLRAEIEAATLARIHAVSDPADVEDPEYAAGLREAVASGFAYGLAALEVTGPYDPASEPIPIQLLWQARYAARSGVSLDTVLRRYFASYTLFGDFLIQAAKESNTSTAELQRALRGEAALFNHLVASVSNEYMREVEGSSRTAEERRAAQVRMMLGGELLDAADLDYELDAWHVGAIAAGSGARATMRDLAAALDRRLLTVRADDGTVWAWLGGRRKLASREILGLAEASWPGEGVLAIGEPGQGVEGWRLTHRQARAAVSIARRGMKSPVGYVDVALLAAAMGDEVLASSLRATFLIPLAEDRDGGATVRSTLDAYFASGRNASATAAALGVSRKTVSLRLRSAEEKLGRPLERCAAELEIALSLGSLSGKPRDGG
jgi:hypothetical protein